MSPETVLWRGRPSLWNSWKALSLSAFCAAAGLVLIWLDKELLAPVPGTAAAVLFVVFSVMRGNRLYTVTNQRVIAQKGLLSKRVTEVEIRDIRNINLQQSFAQRLLGLGDVEISTAGSSDVEVRLRGIPHAERVKETIRQARLAGPAGGDD